VNSEANQFQDNIQGRTDKARGLKHFDKSKASAFQRIISVYSK